MTKIPKDNFVFKKHMTIGSADAENDQSFLEDCFVDTGDYELIANTDSSQSIILGRTGVGKSALLEQLESNNERTIRIEPEELALKHISNSEILNLFETLGVNLDIFYNLLWQHTFVVELIKYKYEIHSELAKTNFLDVISAAISGNQKKQQALKYIEEWESKFWVDTETRIKDFTEKLEFNLKSSIIGKIPGLKLTAEGCAGLTKEQKSEVIRYGKEVVNQVQIEKLAKIVNLLAEDIFNDPQQKTYILIDKLDENWVEDELRYKLIRALIETVKKFRKIKPVKFAITLRTDLLNRVLDKTRDSGFQKEKYKSLFLDIKWTKEQLKTLLDKRVNHLLKHKYTNTEVYFDDVFPAKIDKLSSSDYIIDRTLLRPRDAIMFVNECLIESEGKTEITNSIIKLAEKSYSADRIESLEYEWFVEHPLLRKYINLLHHKNSNFKAKAITDEEIDTIMGDLVDKDVENPDEAISSALDYLKSDKQTSGSYITKLRQNILFILYKVGIVGVKVDGTSSVRWIHDRTQDLTPQKIQPLSIIYIHRMIWRALAIDKRG